MNHTDIEQKEFRDESAFPHVMHEGWQEAHHGLTKRELFAAMAMQGQLSNPSPAFDLSDKVVARFAVVYADALLAALSDEVSS